MYAIRSYYDQLFQTTKIIHQFLNQTPGNLCGRRTIAGLLIHALTGLSADEGYLIGTGGFTPDQTGSEILLLQVLTAPKNRFIKSHRKEYLLKLETGQQDTLQMDTE